MESDVWVEASENDEETKQRTCKMKADFIDEEDRNEIQMDEGLASSYLKCIHNRVAMPRMKYERQEENEEEEGAMVSFNTLEEAEARKKGPDWISSHLGLKPELSKQIHEFNWSEPKPVFFLELGNLILSMTAMTKPQTTTCSGNDKPKQMQTH